MGFLRVTRRSRWFNLDWVPEGEVQGDALSDLMTRGNCLSLYEIRHQSDIIRVAVAFAATRDFVANVDYVLLDRGALTSLGLRICKSAGGTPDQGVNSMHHDIVFLSSRKLSDLASVMSQLQHTRIREKQVLTGIREGVLSGMLDRHAMKDRLVQKIA